MNCNGAAFLRNFLKRANVIEVYEYSLLTCQSHRMCKDAMCRLPGGYRPRPLRRMQSGTVKKEILMKYVFFNYFWL